MLRLPDTGQTTSYTGTFGEDADFTINAPWFALNGDGTVTDTITGLMWQQLDGGEMTIEAAEAYCADLELAGHADWRLPTAHEAFSILNHQYSNPALDGLVFTVTDAEYWWTSTRQVGDSNKVWVTNAGGGIGNHPKTETISAGGLKRFHVRAVRDVTGPAVLPSHYTLNADGTATDLLTGLVWQRVSPMDSLTWEEALTYADTLSHAGRGDWRLPNIKELRSINDERVSGPSFDTLVFGPGGDRKVWSSTTLPNQTAKAWYLHSQFGISTYDVKTRSLHVLCVRDGSDVSTSILPAQAATGVICLYPNPAFGPITVHVPDGRPFVITVFDPTGRLIQSTTHEVFDTRAWMPGTYMVFVETVDAVEHARLIVAH